MFCSLRIRIWLLEKCPDPQHCSRTIFVWIRIQTESQILASTGKRYHINDWTVAWTRILILTKRYDSNQCCGEDPDQEDSGLFDHPDPKNYADPFRAEHRLKSSENHI